jgi:hypothetical protein
MYLFARRRRVRVGHAREGFEWSVAMGQLVTEISGMPISVWTSAWSPEVGTIVWSTFSEDLAGLEALTDSIAADERYHELVAAGESHFDATVDDRLSSVLYGAPGGGTPPAYATSVRATIAAGRFAEGVGNAIVIAQGAEQRTGMPTMVTMELTGVYGTVSWLSGAPDIASVQAAGDALAGDPSWLEVVSTSSGCYVSGAEQLMYRRLG